MQGAQLAVEHLLALGHRRIAYVGAVDRPKSNERRLAGYRCALELAGLTFDPVLVLAPTASDDLERGASVLDRLLTSEVTAVFFVITTK
ncbi:MAG: substrate-binding domain-containing protein [Anaerolineae bacterium]